MKTFISIFAILFVSINCFQHFSAEIAGQQMSSKTTSGNDLSIEDVSFDYDKKVFSDVKSSVVPGYPLEDKWQKPDNVQSRSIRFKLTYRNSKKSPAEISVYDRDEYKDAFALDLGYIEKDFADLQDIINNAGKISSFGLEELPFVPFVDAHQEFYAKAKVIKFQNGRGLLFLTQINQEVAIINNERLIYVFQGLTDDNRHFIYAEFPVSAKGLPESDTDSFEGYTIPAYFYSENLEENQKVHDVYRKKIALRLENLKDEKFKPRLNKIETLLSSIKIK